MEMAKQIFLMLMIVAIGILVQTVTLLKFNPQVVEHLDKINFQRDVNCNTDFHILIQISYLICLKLSCLIQAFRCRNIPGVFNDAMLIVYSCFIGLIQFGIVFPIYYFEENVVNRSFVLWTSFVINSIFMLILYGRKIIVILFYPKKNTIEYIR